MDKKRHTKQEDEDMLYNAMASLYHWSKREDCTNRHKSIGCWQVSHCYMLTGDYSQAERYGKLALEYSINESPFYRGYAHETLARTYLLKNERKLSNLQLQIAFELCDQIENKEEKDLLFSDLNAIK